MVWSRHLQESPRFSRSSTKANWPFRALLIIMRRPFPAFFQFIEIGQTHAEVNDG